MIKMKPLSTIKTRLLIISDTHGLTFPPHVKLPPVDVAIHCRDLAEHSKLAEFETTIKLLEDIPAKLKLVIAGNHDFSLDDGVMEQKIAEARAIATEHIDDGLVIKEYAEKGAALDLLQAAKNKNIVFLHEGSCDFVLDNGAVMKIYASPFTPNHGGDWGFQYHDGHDYTINDGTDVVITHGPPRGIMDMTAEKTRVGCPLLFEAVARARPKVHCFGHVHGGWGAKFVKWRTPLTEKPSHFTDIDNGESCVVSSLAKMTAGGGRREDGGGCYKGTSHCTGDEFPLRMGTTLFVNAACKGEEGLSQMPWVVELELQANSG